MLNRLPPRERQIVDLLFQRGDMAVADICDALPDRLSGSAVRAMLKHFRHEFEAHVREGRCTIPAEWRARQPLLAGAH